MSQTPPQHSEGWRGSVLDRSQPPPPFRTLANAVGVRDHRHSSLRQGAARIRSSLIGSSRRHGRRRPNSRMAAGGALPQCARRGMASQPCRTPTSKPQLATAPKRWRTPSATRIYAHGPPHPIPILRVGGQGARQPGEGIPPPLRGCRRRHVPRRPARPLRTAQAHRAGRHRPARRVPPVPRPAGS